MIDEKKPTAEQVDEINRAVSEACIEVSRLSRDEKKELEAAARSLKGGSRAREACGATY